MISSKSYSKKTELMKLLTIVLLSVFDLGMASSTLARDYSNLVAEGYRWVMVDAHTPLEANIGKMKVDTSRLGNLAENDQVFLFLMDYANRQRIKIWGRAKVVENDPDLILRLMPRNYRAHPEQVIVITVEAWDENCNSNIPHLIPAEEAADVINSLNHKIDLGL